VDELEDMSPQGKYFFWSGNGLAKSTVADWHRSLGKAFKLAGIKGHAHRFRDTFSVNLLQAGVPLETVSVLLGQWGICRAQEQPRRDRSGSEVGNRERLSNGNRDDSRQLSFFQ
jgi:hypothetical protein